MAVQMVDQVNLQENQRVTHVYKQVDVYFFLNSTLNLNFQMVQWFDGSKVEVVQLVQDSLSSLVCVDPE